MRPFSTPLGRWLGVMALAACVATPALAQRNVTLRMNSATMPDTIAAGAAAGAQLRGGLASGTTALPSGETIGWDGTTTVTPTNAGGDYWEVDFQIPDNDKLSFKFYFQQSEDLGIGGWEDNADGTGGNDYVVEAGTDDVVLDLHYFNKTGSAQTYDWRPFAAAGDSVAVWFRVYMDTENAVNDKNYTADDENLIVSLRGNFGERNAVGSEGDMVDWNGTDARLTRESTDTTKPGYALFSGLVKFPGTEAGNAVNYKFYFNDSDVSGDSGYEDGENRSFTIPPASSDTTLHWVFFSNSPANSGAERVTSELTFTVDVTPVNSLGLFATSNDDVQIRGGLVPMTGWNDCQAGDNPTDGCVLTQSISGDLTYSTTQVVESTVGSTFSYKYYVNFFNDDESPQFVDGDGDQLVNIGWEEPLDYGGANRQLTFSGQETAIGPEFFNSIRNGNLLPDNASIDVVFSVDMSGAAAFATDPFDSAQDTVTVTFEDPLWLSSQGYDLTGTDGGLLFNGDVYLINGFKLEDPDGDMVYTGTLKVNGPSYNALAYHYNYARTGDTTLAREGTGGDQPGRRRYRYITDPTASTFTLGRDYFRSNAANSSADSVPLPWEINPTGTFAPGDLDNSVANGYNDQGSFSIPTEGPVESAELSLGNVYPNPTTGIARVVVSGQAGTRVSVRVFDVTGRVVATVAENAAIDGRPLEFNVSGLASGLYLVRADSEAGVATQRLTVVR